MNINDLGQERDAVLPSGTGSSRSHGDTAGGFAERERPYIDDQPVGHDQDFHSRWGSRPPREEGRGLEREGTTLRAYAHLAWARLRKAMRHGH